MIAATYDDNSRDDGNVDAYEKQRETASTRIRVVEEYKYCNRYEGDGIDAEPSSSIVH
jgi:hypothetical protein